MTKCACTMLGHLFLIMASITLTHEYFGWKGVFYRNYNCFLAEISPAGIPVTSFFFVVPPRLYCFVKEL